MYRSTWHKVPTELTWLVCSQYCSLDLFLIRGSSSLYTMCSPMVVKMERPNPTQRSTKSPEKCLMPICKVWGKTEEAVSRHMQPGSRRLFWIQFYFSWGTFPPWVTTSLPSHEGHTPSDFRLLLSTVGTHGSPCVSSLWVIQRLWVWVSPFLRGGEIKNCNSWICEAVHCSQKERTSFRSWEGIDLRRKAHERNNPGSLIWQGMSGPCSLMT